MAKKKRSTRRILIILGILFLGMLAIGFIVKNVMGPRDKGIEVEVAQVETRHVLQVVTASGKIQPEVEVKITPDVSGEIIYLGMKEGDPVQKGELLVRIKPNFYVAQLEQAKAGVSQAKAGMNQAKASMLQAELDLNRQKALFEKNAIAESVFQASKTQYEVAQASYDASRFQVESTQAREREVREQLSKTTIYAPMSGTISQLNVEVGERVLGTVQMAGTEILRIALLDQMELEADINENDVVNISVGDTATIEIDAYPEKQFKGVVMEIANSARIQSQGTQEQVTNFPVKVRVLDAHNEQHSVGTKGNLVQTGEVSTVVASTPQFRPGMSGTVDVYTNLVENVVAVPIQAVTVRDINKVKKKETESEKDEGSEEDMPAIQEEDLRKVIFIMVDGKAKMIEVETGIADETHIEIKSGLSGDETIIVGPYRAVSRTLEPDADVKTKKEGSGRRRIASE